MQTENMGSRRLMNRSLSGDGRYYYSGNDITSQNSRDGCRSYLNSVRPERRSTLCSVMAQLAEETQPTFESTLKSKAVSEATNVNFICMVSGHPAPDVTWYKDDAQLDRYCGLPKYEILHDGKTHTLNIYNCTLEDAAIYQASAQNSRGIVSCSGVLEVGTMNEYKIHQNYFAKLKQRNKNRCREQEEPRKSDKDNVPEALRTSSPDRTQRKRRSPMETTPSFGSSRSSEEKEELNALSQTSAVEDRLSSPVQVPESTPIQSLSDSKIMPNVDKGNQGLTYFHDTMHTAATKQTGNYAKKKIKKREEMTETDMRNDKKTSFEQMEVQNNIIQNNVDITADTKQREKQSMKANKGATDLKTTQVTHKPIPTPRHPALKVTMATETKVVEDTKQINSSDNQKSRDRRSPLIKPHSQLQSQTTKHVQNQRVENGTQSSPDNKLMDLDDSKSKLAEDQCVRILPHSCGKGDVNADSGDRNSSAQSPRASAGGDSHIEPKEPEPSSVRKVAMELKQPPTLMHDVTSRVTDTPPILGSYTKERAEDQYIVLKNNSTERHKPDLESTQLGEKTSKSHVSNSLQDGQVTTVVNSSMEEDTLTKMSEKDHTDGNLMMKRVSDKSKAKIKSVATSLNGTEVNEMGINADKKKVGISANVQGQKSISEEKSTSSKHSVSLVREIVPIHSHSNMSNPDVGQSQIMNDSLNANALMNHTKALEFQKDSHVATDSISKMDIQEQGQSNTAKNKKEQSFTSKASTIDIDPEGAPPHIDSPTFLSQQHPKTFLSNFTIPAIYVTDVDSTSPNTKTENKECLSNVRKSNNVKTSAKPNVLNNNNNTVSQKVNISDHTDNIDKTIVTPESVGLPDGLVDLSLHPQSTASLNQAQQKPLSQENFVKTSGSQRSTESIDFTAPVGRCMQLSNADKSKKANKSDLTETKCPVLLANTDSYLKTESDYFIKQLKSAALDLEMSNQRSTSVTLHDTSHRDSEGKDKYRQTNSEVKQGESVLLQGSNDLNTVVCPLSPSSDVTIPLKTTDAQIFTISEPNKTEKRDVEQANQKCTYQEQIQPFIAQPASPLNLVNDSTSLENNSPHLTRKAITADLAKLKGNENVKTESLNRNKENKFKVPQVIRKIRPEVFDTSGNLKLWCQFFNIVSDSTTRWFKDDVEIAEIKRSKGDETQLCLAIIQLSKRDCGVYRCNITNEYGQDSTEYLLSTETVSSMFLREELHEVGEEIEMTPLIFSKGLADASSWGSKFYGRVTTEEVQVGSGCKHKTRRLRVIYGLDPVFESGSSCLMKVRSPIAYESREETVLAEKNLQITKQDCRIQNMAREYVKIFATETREIESFGSALEIIPLYFMYRPASSVPYGTVEVELKGVYLRYCGLDHTGTLVYNNKSEVAQKCSSFQHWIHQWTSGNVLFSRLEGVDTILTNIEVVTKSKGYQGFPCEANPKVFEQFPTEHQCNYFCGLLNLKPPELPEMLQTVRYRGSSSPQTQRKATKSPKVSCRSNPQTST